jgi:hypothetical protein
MAAFMATQAEIEAAAMAIQAIEDPLEPVSEFIPAARAALEAAERVRPRRDLTAAARMRQFRAKRRAEHAVTRAVTREVTPERAVTGDVTRAVTREAAPIDKIDSERASILSSRPLLLANLIEAADGNVAPGAVDVAPIQVLLAAGCDLDLDVLPVVRDLATSQTPIKRWDHPGLIRAILRGREIRIAPKTPPPSPPASTRPAFRPTTWTSSSPATGPATWIGIRTGWARRPVHRGAGSTPLSCGRMDID